MIYATTRFPQPWQLHLHPTNDSHSSSRGNQPNNLGISGEVLPHVISHVVRSSALPTLLNRRNHKIDSTTAPSSPSRLQNFFRARLLARQFKDDELTSFLAATLLPLQSNRVVVFFPFTSSPRARLVRFFFGVHLRALTRILRLWLALRPLHSMHDHPTTTTTAAAV